SRDQAWAADSTGRNFWRCRSGARRNSVALTSGAQVRSSGLCASSFSVSIHVGTRPFRALRHAPGACRRRAVRPKNGTVPAMAYPRTLTLVYHTPWVKRLLWRSVYDFLARRYRDQRWTFMNYGYRPPHDKASVALAPEDEPDRSCIELYGLVAGAVDLTGGELLEVGSGRGGGASFVA